MFLSRSSQEIIFRIAYFGPPDAGKTTNLQYIYSRTRPDQRDRIYVAPLDGDSLYWMDMRVPSISPIDGATVRLQLQALRGPVRHLRSIERALEGADGVVFVADCDPARRESNQAALAQLSDVSRQQGRVLPTVLQLNKASKFGTGAADALTDALSMTLPTLTDWPRCHAEATTGVGVYDALKAVIKGVVDAHRQGSLVAAPPVGNVLTDLLAGSRARGRLVRVYESRLGALEPDAGSSHPVHNSMPAPYYIGLRAPSDGRAFFTYFTVGFSLMTAPGHPRLEFVAYSPTLDGDIAASLGLLGQGMVLATDQGAPRPLDAVQLPSFARTPHLLLLESTDTALANFADDELAALLGDPSPINHLVALAINPEEYRQRPSLSPEALLEHLHATGRNLAFRSGEE
jgi:hypothetical protein